MIDLVFTNDWELFGDGTGDYYEIQHNPTLDLLDYLENNNAGVSFFVEIGQLITFKNSGVEKYQKIAEDCENLIKQIYSNKLNDVCLHIHPQWFFSIFDGSYWKLPEDKWSIGKLNKDKQEELIKLGKDYLEGILKDYNFKCEVFRAGAYYIEPSENIIDILEQNNFLADSSVTLGRKVNGYYDWSDAVDNVGPWNVTDRSLKYNGNRKLKEYPIYSKMIIYSEALNKFSPKFANKLHYGVVLPKDELDWIKKRDEVKEKRYPRANRPYKKLENRDLYWYVNKIYSKQYIQLDYDYLPATAFIKVLETCLNKNQNIDIPVIASGHIKDAHTNFNLEKIINILNKNFKNQIKITNFKNLLNKY